MTKLVVAGLLLIIVYSMGSALVFLIRDKDGSKRTVKALTMRVAFSVLTLGVLLFAAYMGWITPNGSPYGGS